MKNSSVLLPLAFAFALKAAGQSFTSGSDGSLGALNVTENMTVDLPPNGILNYTTINIDSGRTLTFRSNPNNTPVYLLAQGDVVIEGTIDVSGTQGNNVQGGLPGPGGFGGGSPGSVGVAPGDGHGPGGGKAGDAGSGASSAGGGSYATRSGSGSTTRRGATYGTALLIPIVGGSGGAGTVGTPGQGGGGGGGGITVASTTKITLGGRIAAFGGRDFGSFNAGSGGAIRLVAPVVAGDGNLDVGAFTGGGVGRIRVDATDRSGISFSLSPSPATASFGSMLLVFPSPFPRLDIVEAAGTVIAEGSGPVNVQLPFGSSPARQVKVQARDFNAVVPITIVLTPDHGPSSSVNAEIDNTAGKNPAVSIVDVTLPVNEQTAIRVYTR